MDLATKTIQANKEVREPAKPTLHRLFAPSVAEIENLDASWLRYKESNRWSYARWWTRDPGPGSPPKNANCVISATGEITRWETDWSNGTVRVAFLLNEEGGDFGRWPRIGFRLNLELKDGQKSEFGLCRVHEDGSRVMLALDKVLSRETLWGNYPLGYENSTLCNVIQDMEQLLTPESLALMLPVNIAERDRAYAAYLEAEKREAEKRHSDSYCHVCGRYLSDFEPHIGLCPSCFDRRVRDSRDPIGPYEQKWVAGFSINWQNYWS